MPNNRYQVEQRARWLKQKFLNKPQLFADYRVFVDNLIKKSYARKVLPDRLHRKDGKVWYIPHHGVYHPHKPGKIRVVFDCSYRYRGTSLNDHLLSGPDLTNHLIGVLLRFRQDPISFMADIESMFFRVRVPDCDTDSLRSLWWPEGDLTKDLEEYQMLVHLFGAASSPSCSNFALLKTAEDNKETCDAEVTNTVKRNFYVDDYLKSTPTVDHAISLVRDLRELLAKGGFHLTKWTSNSRQVLESIPKEERAKQVKDLDLNQDKLPIERALGIQWCAEFDQFAFKMVIKELPPTRRGILSVVSSIYDPPGFLSPVILNAKVILQELCRLKIGWEGNIPSKYVSAWQQWLADLPKLSHFKIPRCYKPSHFQVKSSQLHHFSDASGYGSVSYLRQESHDKRVYCSFLMGKSRLTPLKPATIHRLELSAATVSRFVSTRCLRKNWIFQLKTRLFGRTENNRFHTFVANRIAIIRVRSDPAQWRHVDSTSNPAYFASRGLTIEAFLNSNRWINGPDFLWTSNRVWPRRSMALGVSAEIPVGDPEVKLTHSPA